VRFGNWLCLALFSWPKNHALLPYAFVVTGLATISAPAKLALFFQPPEQVWGLTGIGFELGLFFAAQNGTKTPKCP